MEPIVFGRFRRSPMLFKWAEETFPLTYTGIDEASEWLENWLEQMKVERRNMILMRLSMEEAMLRICERCGADDSKEVRMIAGSNLAGSFVRLEHRGQAYNPLGEENDMGALWSSSLFTSLGLRPQYAYVGTLNVLRITFSRRRMNPALALVGGIAMGVLFGMLGNALFPPTTREMVVVTAVNPIFEMWTRTLNAIAGPVIFFMVITTMLNTQKVEERGGNKMQGIARYFILCLIMGVVGVAIAACLFRPEFSGDYLGLRDVNKALSGVANTIPQHILEPFTTSNTPQLMLLAFVLGNAIIALGERAGNVEGFVRQMNMACSLITTWASALVPLLSGILLALEIWENGLTLFVQIWQPLFLGIVIALLFIGLGLGHVYRKLRVGPLKLVRKLLPPFVVAVRTGTLDAAYGEVEHSCVQALGIDSTFTSVMYPQGLVLYMPASIIGTLVFTVFVARGFDVSVSLWWFALAAFLDVLLFVATPPVPGANLLAFITLFHMLGIPDMAFLDAMIFDILFGLFANAANQTMLQIELMLQADRLGLVNRSVLRK